MSQESNFTEGKILSPLIRFMVPVFLAMFLQAMYGAVDLLIVGKFAQSVDVSAVSTGSQIMMTITNLVTSFAMGTTILLGQRIGEGRGREGGQVIGSSICMFGVIAGVFTVLIPLLSSQLSSIMNAPSEAFAETSSYIRICGFGSLFIIAYNLIGSIFRGIGDSKTPLMTVMIACVCNIAGDLLLVAVFHMGTAGAAIATVAAQMISVMISLLILRRRGLPFQVERADLRFDGRIIRNGDARGLRPPAYNGLILPDLDPFSRPLPSKAQAVGNILRAALFLCGHVLDLLFKRQGLFCFAALCLGGSVSSRLFVAVRFLRLRLIRV